MVDYILKAKKALLKGDAEAAYLALEALEEKEDKAKSAKSEMYMEHIERELDTLESHLKRGKDEKEIHDYLKERKADYKDIEDALRDKFYKDLTDEDREYLQKRIKEIQKLCEEKHIKIDEAFSKTWKDLFKALALHDYLTKGDKVDPKKGILSDHDNDEDDEDDDDEDEDEDDEDDEDDDDEDDDEDEDKGKKAPIKVDIKASKVPVDKKVKAVLAKK